MSPRIAERRRAVRAPAAFPATLRDRRGHVLARGRTANISEIGALLLVRPTAGPIRVTKPVLEVVLPATAEPQAKRSPKRTVRYRCRIVRTTALGHMLGIGVELIEKLA